MLRIATEIRPSTIPGSGLGLFCIDPVPRQFLIWTFDEGLDIRLAVLPTHPIIRAFIATYGYRQTDGTPGYVLCMDNARFMNHADASRASCLVTADGTTYAARDLAAGTELTCSYPSFSAKDPALGWVGDEESEWPSPP